MKTSKVVDPRRKLAGGAIFIFSLALIPITLVHETGHYLVCRASGNDCTIGINYQGGYSVCMGEPANAFLYSISGGLLAATIALSPLAFRSRLPNYAVIASLALGLPEIAKAILEGFAKDTYTSGILSVPLLAAYFGTLTILIVIALRKMQRTA